MKKQNGKEKGYSVMGLYYHLAHLEETSKDPSIAFTSHSATLENLNHLGKKDTERENVTKLS